MTTSALALATIHVLNIVAIITVIFFQRKESSTRFAWLLVLILLPVGGFFLYLFFGHDYTRRERLKIGEEAAKALETLVDGQISSTKNMDFADRRFVQLARMNLVNNHALLTDDNSVRIFTTGAEKFEQLLHDMRHARKYIHMIYFIFRTDELGEKILSVLAEKAAEGVDVKLVYDDIGNLAVSGYGFAKLREAGGKVFRYSPLFPGLFSANYRNHRKLAIIDGEVGYIGGMNVGTEYIHGRKALTPWRDTHVRVEGSVLGAMEALFLPDYVFAANKEDRLDDLGRFIDPIHSSRGNSIVQILASAPQPGKYHVHDAYVKIISAAERYLYIQTPYLVPDRTIMDALRIALGSGVDVRIMIPKYPDKRFVYYASLDYALELQALGARIYLYRGFIHSKTMLADDQVVSIGSANLDVRSFFLSYEANLLLFDKELVISQRDQFLLDAENSDEAGSAYFANCNPIVKLLKPACRLFSPLL